MLKKFLFMFVNASVFAVAQSGNPPIITGQYDTNRTSANSNETVLNTSNVNVNQFGKLFSWTVDGQIFAQPLYVPGVNINGKTTNVVYVATMHNSIYAFDANSSANTPLWQVNFGASVPSGNTTQSCPAATFEGPELGILSTPVIDQSTNTLYAVSASPVSGGYMHTIHAIDISTHQEKFGGPTQIQASVATDPNHPAYNAQNGRVYLGPASTEVQRTALLLANKTVYAGFGNCGPDPDPWHGWVIGYNASNLQSQNVLFNATPNGGQGGIWQSTRGLVVDGSGNLYFATGNATPTSQTGYNNASITTGDPASDAGYGNYPQRLLKTNSAGQILATFPPVNYQTANTYDLDFSSSGPLLIPGTTLMAAGGKDGVMYLFDINNLGSPLQSFQATGGGSPCQPTGNGCDQIRGVAFWNNHLYIWGTNDVLRSFTFSNSQFNTNTASQNNTIASYPSAVFAVSANGTQNGIVWATTPADHILHAYDATNVATELWNSNQNSGRDALPSFARFAMPTIANGRVYMATASGQLAVYGVLSEFTLAASPSSQSVNQGSATSFTATVTSVSGLSNPVNLSISGLPSGATASFNPASVNGSGSSTVTISTAGSTPTGTYNLLISGTEGGQTRTASVTLVVTTPDTTPPTATCCTYTTSGSYYVLNFTGQDTGSGMKSIVPVQLVNATANVPPFTSGTTSIINFSATESGWSSYAKFQLTDVAGNTTYIDPVTINAGRQPGTPVPFEVNGITPDEHILTIINKGPHGEPGLKNVRIEITDGPVPTQFEVAGLTDGETRILDLVQYLVNPFPYGTTVNIIPLGKPGGIATFIFASPNVKITVQ